MEIAIQPVGKVDPNILQGIQKELCNNFPSGKCVIFEKPMPLPKNGYNRARQQYHSTIMLKMVHQFTEETRADRVLGVVDVDLYSYGLNFVFGEAENPGKAAIISLRRLSPMFYGQTANKTLLMKRAVKEAVHEVGHTFGLKHCENKSCVMHFSNSIMDTDRKKPVFCEKCYSKISEQFEHERV